MIGWIHGAVNTQALLLVLGLQCFCGSGGRRGGGGGGGLHLEVNLCEVSNVRSNRIRGREGRLEQDLGVSDLGMAFITFQDKAYRKEL